MKVRTFLWAVLIGAVVAIIGAATTKRLWVGLVVVAFVALCLFLLQLLERRRPDPATLPPPTREQLDQAREESEWGDRRYLPESSWNAVESTAYLILKRRDTESQSFQVKVTDPSGVETTSGLYGADGKFFTVFYPEDFDAVSPPVPSGTYQVDWYALVQGQVNRMVTPLVATGEFRIP